MAIMKRIGFGQVEPNHLSAQGNREIYAQLPAADSIKVLENGQFVKYDYAAGEVNYTGEGEWFMVFNEIKKYDERKTNSDRYFAMQAKDYTPGSTSITHSGLGPFKGTMYPRVIATKVGDIYTTNSLAVGNTSDGVEVEMEDYAVGDKLVPTADGFLKKGVGSAGEMVWKVVKRYTMPDGQEGVKLQRIQ